MKAFYDNIENRVVYPILIKNNEHFYLTLFYYTERSDSILHNALKQLLYFNSQEDMISFCNLHDLTIAGDIAQYDFDAPVSNPIDYKRLLDNWNLLNTIAAMFGMFFEGNLPQYTSLYQLLFRLNTQVAPISPTHKVGAKHMCSLLKVFRKKDRYFDLFKLYI